MIGKLLSRLRGVDARTELRHFGQVNADHGLAGTEVLVGFDGVGGQGQFIDLERNETNIKLRQPSRQFSVGLLAQKTNIAAMHQLFGHASGVVANEQNLRMRKTLCHCFNEGRVKPVSNGTVVTDHGLGFAGCTD